MRETEGERERKPNETALYTLTPSITIFGVPQELLPLDGALATPGSRLRRSGQGKASGKAVKGG